MYKYFIPCFSQSAASSLKRLTEPRNEMLNMTTLMLVNTIVDFIQNKQQRAQDLGSVVHNPKNVFLQ